MKMKNTHKKLPINDSPIKYILRFFTPLMIAFQKPDEVEGWFYSSYVQTKVRKKTYKLWMIYQNYNPFVLRLPCFLVSSKAITKSILLKVIKRLIDNNWYISTCVDMFYLSSSFFYNKKHYDHAVIIRGYDILKNELQLCGYCFNSKITCINVNFDEFLISFLNCKHNRTWIYKRRKKKNKKFDMKFFYLGVKGYATSSCSLAYQIKARSFSLAYRELYGINAHIQLKDDLNKVFLGENKSVVLRLYSYFELSECMTKRLNYLESNHLLNDIEDISNGFKELSQAYMRMLNLFMKYDISKNINIIERIIAIENQTCEKEKQLYTILYKKIETQYSF